jgi:hypothetical protein
MGVDLTYIGRPGGVESTFATKLNELGDDATPLVKPDVGSKSRQRPKWTERDS